MVSVSSASLPCISPPSSVTGADLHVTKPTGHFIYSDLRALAWHNWLFFFFVVYDNTHQVSTTASSQPLTGIFFFYCLLSSQGCPRSSSPCIYFLVTSSIPMTFYHFPHLLCFSHAGDLCLLNTLILESFMNLALACPLSVRCLRCIYLHLL